MIAPQAAGSKHLEAFRARHAREDEFVTAALAGYRGKMFGKGSDVQKNGVLILTATRLVFYRKGMLGEIVETMPLAKITSVEMQSRMGVRTLTLHTSHDALAFSTMENKADFDVVRDAIERARDGERQPQVAPAAQLGDPGEALRKLASLHAAGLLTDAEFATKRAEIIARL